MHPLTIQSWYAVRAMTLAASVLAAHAGFSLADRAGRTDRLWPRRGWLAAAACVLGLGVWSMHFFGALDEPGPREDVVYSLLLVALCLLLAMSTAWAGLRLIVWRPTSRVRLVTGGLVIGGGAILMQFLGIVAVPSIAIVAVRPGFLLLDVLSGLLVTLLAIWLAFVADGDSRGSEWLRVGGSLIMGCGIALLHLLALRAVVLVPVARKVGRLTGGQGAEVGEVAMLVTIGLVLLITLGTAAVDKRRYRELSVLHAQLAASEQALLRSEVQLREANTMLSELSIRDSLTGLHNRRRFDEVFQTEWKRSLRTLRPLALLMIDVDQFKYLNDTYGHQRGDECLREIARVIEEQPRRGHDIVARFGGEEFTVLLPGADAPGAMRIGENIRRAVEALQMEHKASTSCRWVTVSIGVCSRTPRIGESPKDMLYDADMALYLAKQLGRNRVEMREAAAAEV